MMIFCRLCENPTRTSKDVGALRHMIIFALLSLFVCLFAMSVALMILLRYRATVVTLYNQAE